MPIVVDCIITDLVKEKPLKLLKHSLNISMFVSILQLSFIIALVATFRNTGQRTSRYKRSNNFEVVFVEVVPDTELLRRLLATWL